ncbi:MAG: MBL fold metallo-hydrolase [Erysipelotrichia bacterium]|nr:MBL fold metallo-hydrolase [Erysipelotrichia bacterium]
MMIHRYLSIAFAMSLLVIVSSVLARGMIIGFSIVYFYPFLKKYTIVLFVFLLCFTCYIHHDVKLMNHNVVKVEEIRSHYIIASNHRQKCILYNVKGVSLYDIIQVEGNYSFVSSNQNRHSFQFVRYLQRKGIDSSMYVTSYKTITKAKHIKTKLFDHVNQIENKTIKEYLQKVFYRINEDEQEYAYFVYASGLHVGFLIYLCSKLLRKNYHHCAIIISFAMMLLFPASAYMHRIFVFSLIAILFPTYPARSQLGLAMIVLYLINPAIIYEISFIIPVAFRLVNAFDVVRIHKKLKQFFVLFAIQLYFFHECNLLSLLLFPMLRISNGITFIMAIIALCCPFIYPLLNWLIHIQTQFLSLLSLSYRFIGKPSILWVILWCILVILFISKKSKKYYLYLLLLVVWQNNMHSLSFYGEVMFIDVGQGDCILIKEPFFGEVLLIDVAGKINKNIAQSIIYPVLKARGIKVIDKVLITHDDYDHAGGLKDLKKLIKIKEVIKEKKDIQLKYLHFNAYQSEQAHDENERSIVLFSQINKLNYLFMGDASKRVEEELIDRYNQLDVDILKVGHHGSKTSSSLSFIHQIRPLVSVISSGRNNMYKHPNQEVLAILEKEHSLIMNTQIHGSISIYFHPLFNIMISGNQLFVRLP